MKFLPKALENYLALRRALGFKLEIDGRLLAQFVCFLKEQSASHITTELAVRWATKPRNAQPGEWARRLRMVRIFAEYLSAHDPQTEVPPQKLLPERYQRKPPYIYTDKQVIGLIEAARRLPSIVPGTTGLRAWTYSTLFGLLAVTGMRDRSEALALDREDVDCACGVITIRGAKFGKSRLVPIHPSTRRVLQRYARFRDRVFPRPKTQSFFVSERGTRLGYWGVLRTFVRLSRQLGLRGSSASRGPRIHDLRHRFAVRTLIGWYRKRVNVDCHILELSTFLGHVKVSDTYWYLSAVPELLRLATARLERNKGGELS